MIDLDKLDKLHEAAAPAEWIAHRSEIIRRDNDTEPWFIIGDLSSDDSPGTMNAEFVVALRNSYPAMAAELRRLRMFVDDSDTVLRKIVPEHTKMREALHDIVVYFDEDISWYQMTEKLKAIARRALEEVEG